MMGIQVFKTAPYRKVDPSSFYGSTVKTGNERIQHAKKEVYCSFKQAINYVNRGTWAGCVMTDNGAVVAMSDNLEKIYCLGYGGAIVEK